MLVKDYLVKNHFRIWEEKKHRNESFRRVESFAEFHHGLHIEDVTAQHVYDWMDKLETTDLSKASINRYVAAVKALLRFAKASGIDVNMFSIKSFKEKNRIRYFTPDELEAIYVYINRNHVPHWFKHMCILARYTGMRHGEIAGLIRGTKAYLDTDEDGVLWIELQDTKNGDDRTVPLIHAAAVNAAKALNCLNLREHGKNAYREKEFYRLWEHMRNTIARGDEAFVFHVFRHTAASHMANELRLNSDVIGQWLGHRNPATTSKYVHIKPASMREIAAELAKSA